METPVVSPAEIPEITPIPKPVELNHKLEEEPRATTLPAPRPRKRPKWVTILAVIVFIGMLGIIGVLSFFVVRSNSIIDAQETALARATQTIQAQDQALDKSAMIVQAQNKTIYEAAATMQAQASVIVEKKTALDKAQATIRAQENIIAAIPSGFESKLIKGPSSGILLHHPSDTLIELKCAGVKVKEFITSVQFTNPNEYSNHSFDFGVRFGDNYRLSLANGVFMELFHGSSTFLQRRPVLRQVNLGRGEANDLMVMVKHDIVYFALNDVSYSMYVEGLSKAPSGDVCIGTGFFKGNEAIGGTTKYSDFSVWALIND